MDILSIIFIAILFGVLGFAWVHLRSNWRSVQSMRENNRAPVDESGFDLPESLCGSHHHGHGHEGSHHGGDVGGHDVGDFHGAIMEGSTEVAGIIESGFLQDQACQ